MHCRERNRSARCHLLQRARLVPVTDCGDRQLIDRPSNQAALRNADRVARTVRHG